MIRKNWAVIVIGVALVAIMSATAYLQSEKDKGDGDPSSYSTLRRGGKAAYMLLQQSGYPIERWEHSPKELPKNAEGVLLIIAEPVTFATTEELNAISKFLLAGGSILLAGPMADCRRPGQTIRKGG